MLSKSHKNYSKSIYWMKNTFWNFIWVCSYMPLASEICKMWCGPSRLKCGRSGGPLPYITLHYMQIWLVVDEMRVTHEALYMMTKWCKRSKIKIKAHMNGWNSLDSIFLVLLRGVLLKLNPIPFEKVDPTFNESPAQRNYFLLPNCFGDNQTFFYKSFTENFLSGKIFLLRETKHLKM